jgi:hypothetical protein
MAKCHHCGSRKFGLVQHRLITFQGILRFCTKKCKEDYQKKRQDEVSRRKSVRKLFKERST